MSIFGGWIKGKKLTFALVVIGFLYLFGQETIFGDLSIRAMGLGLIVLMIGIARTIVYGIEFPKILRGK